MQKLYIIVRADLKPGLQIAQACHALRQFTEDCTELDRIWFERSNNIVVLQVPDEEALIALCQDIENTRLACATFNEPDLDDEMTAIALYGEEARRLVSKLPLALGSGGRDHLTVATRMPLP